MSVAPSDVIVVGAGVSGLTTALCLARAGTAVRVVSDRAPLATTSAVAGAVWGLYAEDDDRAITWGLETWEELQQLADRTESGIRMVEGIEAAHMSTSPPSWLAKITDQVTPVDHRPPNGYAAAWHYRVPVVEMHSYMRFLTSELSALDVSLDVGPPVHALAQLAGQADAIVNCTGLGARELVPDDEMYPVQGQLVVVDNPGVDDFFIDDPHPETHELTYILPHGSHVVLGGSWVPNSDDVSPDKEVSRKIIARCAAIEPVFEDAVPLDVRVGLRPARSRVRVEREDYDSHTVVHNYGHGGAGLTLSWGCASTVRELLNSC